MNTSFFKSARFWKLFVIGVVTALANWDPAHPTPTSLIPATVATGIITWLGGSVAVRTADRAADAKAAAATPPA